MSGHGYVKLMRTQDTIELLRHPYCFTLLAAIAVRARRTRTLGVDDLRPGEALIGDHDNYGMSRQQYRTALGKLAKARLITIRTTNKGTVASIVDTNVYDINAEVEQPPGQPPNNPKDTTKQPPGIHPPTTNKNEKNERRRKYNYGKLDRDFSSQRSSVGEKITV